MHHMTYDGLWELFEYAGEKLVPGGILLFDYVPITTEIGAKFLRRKHKSEWPYSIWHPAQIEAMLAIAAPTLVREEIYDRPRILEVWRKENTDAAEEL